MKTMSCSDTFFDKFTKIENILKGKYTVFENEFNIHKVVFLSKVKQSNLKNEEWKRSSVSIPNVSYV